MVALFVLHLACTAVGLPGNECLATAFVESGLRPSVVSEAGCVGVMQVCSSSLPRGILALTVVNAYEGARILKAWHRYRPAHPWRGYACGWVDGSPECAKHEAKVRAVLKTLLRRVPLKVTMETDRLLRTQTLGTDAARRGGYSLNSRTKSWSGAGHVAWREKAQAVGFFLPGCGRR